MFRIFFFFLKFNFKYFTFKTKKSCELLLTGLWACKEYLQRLLEAPTKCSRMSFIAAQNMLH